MNRPALKSEPFAEANKTAEPSMARQKLADAIAKANQAARLLKACDAALTELRNETSQTRFALRTAEEEIVAAEQNVIADLMVGA
jgi:hypothetical protein